MLEDHHLQATTTADGSVTLRHIPLDVLYRSDQGAIGEAKHVFIGGTGLPDIQHAWRVLELGFGTALTFLVTAEAAQVSGRTLVYTAVDAAPIPPGFVPANFTCSALVERVLHAVRNERQTITMSHGDIHLTLHPHPWQQTKLTLQPVHAVFHDPFDPTVNPECWTPEAFAWGRAVIREDGKLATYSAAGRIRRAMRDAGYVVARAPGYGRKREMTIASPTERVLTPLAIKYRP